MIFLSDFFQPFEVRFAFRVFCPDILYRSHIRGNGVGGFYSRFPVWSRNSNELK